ncbi:hypothetical protein [Vannielia sp. SX4]|uniref:hypothetical protein n=1 Tax=Vannielia sp. SX4 TaxID=3463852 RepID=UPI004059E05A
MQRISFQVSHATLSSLMDEAQRADISVGQLLRDAVRRELRRRHTPAKTPRRADERLVARLGALLAPAFADAESWEHLQCLLQRKGFELRPAGGGLTLNDIENGNRVCKASELGYPYARLIGRFRTAFPGHAHQHLVERVLGELNDGPDDDFDVIERPAPTSTHPRPRAASSP